MSLALIHISFLEGKKNIGAGQPADDEGRKESRENFHGVREGGPPRYHYLVTGVEKSHGS